MGFLSRLFFFIALPVLLTFLIHALWLTILQNVWLSWGVSLFCAFLLSVHFYLRLTQPGSHLAPEYFIGAKATVTHPIGLKKKGKAIPGKVQCSLPEGNYQLQAQLAADSLETTLDMGQDVYIMDMRDGVAYVQSAQECEAIYLEAYGIPKIP